jgi:hypothetical protein
MIEFGSTSTELATTDGSSSAALLAPTVAVRGPVKPGDHFPVSFPLRALGGTDGKNVRVRFLAEAAKCDPEYRDLGALDVGQSIVATTFATVSPLNGKRSVKIWTEVECGDQSVQSEAIMIPIAARGHLVLSAEDDGTELAVSVTNDGTAPLAVLLDLATPDHIHADDLELAENGTDIYTSSPFTLGVGEGRVIRVRGGSVDHVVARSSDGERASALPLRREPVAATVLDASLHVEAPETGVRRGDMFALVGTVIVRGPIAASDVVLVLGPIAGADVRVEEITIDGIRPIAPDLEWQAEKLHIRLGHLAGGRSMSLRMPLRVTIDDPKAIDALRVDADLQAAGIPTQALSVDIAVDRRPAFLSTSTYLGPIIDRDDRFSVLAQITNADGGRIERVRVRYETSDVVPDKIVLISRNDGEPQESPLRPSALNEAANLFVDLGALDAGERVRVVMPFRPARGQDGFRTMIVRATLLADDETLPLGTAERRIPGRVDMRASSVRRLDASALRLGMPTEMKLQIRNDGDSPAHDIRLSLDLPSSVAASLPEPADGARWRPLIPMLPPGGAVETTLTLYLQSPPDAGHAIVRVSIDAREQSELSLATLDFETPSDPLIDPPRVRTLALDDGHIALIARVTNHGDGTASDVVIWVEDANDILLRTTSVDGQAAPDRGARPILAEGLRLGDLEPGAYRDVTWVAAPPTADPYRCTVAARVGAKGEVMRTSTIPTRPRHRTGVSTPLPSARRIGAEDDLAASIAALRPGVPDRAQARIALDAAPSLAPRVDVPPAIAADAVAALTGGTEHTSNLPPAVDAGASERDIQDRLAQAASAIPAPPPPEPERPAAFARLDALESGAPPEPTPPEPQTAAATTTGTPEAAGVAAAPVVPPAEPVAGVPIEPEPPAPVAAVEPQADPVAPVNAAAAAAGTTDHVNTSSSARVETQAEPQRDGAAHDGAEPEDLLDAVDTVVPPANAPEGAGSAETTLASVQRGERFTIVSSFRAANVQKARRMAQSMIDIQGLGWWRHVMFIRTMLPERMPLDGPALEAWNFLRGAFTEPLARVFPTTLVDPFHASDAFVDALSINDADAIAALDVLLADQRVPLFVGAATGSTMLDVALPCALPDTLEDPLLDQAWVAYKQTAMRLFASASIQSMSEGDRRVKYANANATLDEALGFVLRDFPE